MTTKLAWAAGFFDGEGWSGTARRATPMPILRSAIGQYGNTIPPTLARFQEAVGGLGSISGPYGSARRAYSWHASKGGTIEALTLIWPWLGSVKRAQFRAALVRGCSPGWSEPPPIEPSDEETTAWCAGLFDGEGWSGTTASGTAGRRRLVTSVTQASHDGSPEVLRRLQAAMGGMIYGPLVLPPRAPRYTWRLNGQDVLGLLARLRPWLTDAKIRQADMALQQYFEQPACARRGRRGYRKAACVRGHDYSDVRLYPAIRSDGDPYTKRYCIPCDRVRKTARTQTASTEL